MTDSTIATCGLFEGFHSVLDQLLRASADSAAEVARHAKVSPSALSRWRTGKSTPDIAGVGRVLEVLGVTLHQVEELLASRSGRPLPAGKPPAGGGKVLGVLVLVDADQELDEELLVRRAVSRVAVRPSPNSQQAKK